LHRRFRASRPSRARTTSSSRAPQRIRCVDHAKHCGRPLGCLTLVVPWSSIA
jgi:hypothetical protein